MDSILLAIAIFAPVAGSLAVLLTAPKGLQAGRLVAASCGLASIAAIALVVWSGVRSDGIVGDLAGLDLRVGRASSLLLAVVTATGVVVASFARRNVDLDLRAGRFFALLGVLVTGSALVAVPGGAVALIAGWWASSLALVGLVGHRNELATSRIAQRRTARALLIGDVALTAAVALLVGVAGSDATLDLGLAVSELESSTILGIGAADVFAVLIVIAGLSRSALVPFHRWLVATLAAPTPVSALVHAGFVSGAGLLLIRFGPIVLESFVAVHLAFALAALTVLVAVGAGATRADVKGKLAWSTVSQMGFMVVQCTVGAFSSALFHIAGHGMYKASLFLGAGDAISAGLRSSRRPPSLTPPSPGLRLGAATVIPTVAIALGLLLAPPDVSDGGVILVAVFAWFTVAQGVWGWLDRASSPTPRALVESTIGGFAAVMLYLGGLRAVEYFVKPTFGDFVEGSGVRPATLITTLGIVALLGLGWRFWHTPTIDRARASIDAWLHRTAHPAVAGDFPLSMKRADHLAAGSTTPQTAPDKGAEVETRRSQIRADVTRAGNVIAPAWPLTSFVAVNPLGGLEQLGFDDAAAVARQQLGARTHLTLEEYRRDHERGVTTQEDLHWSIESHFFELCAMAPIEAGGRELSVSEIIEADLLHGPDCDDAVLPRTAIERLEGVSGPAGQQIDHTIWYSAAQFVAHPPSTDQVDAFVARWIGDAIEVAALRHRLSKTAVRWLRELATDPAQIIDASLSETGIDDDDRIAEMRGHLARLQGWAGYAKWRVDWAHADEARPLIAPIDLVAARCALEAACLMSETSASTQAGDVPSDRRRLPERVDAVLTALGITGPSTEARDAVMHILSLVDPTDRRGAWLRAQERSVDHGLLTTLDRLDPGAALREPEAQLTFCIDVRSEGLRREIEAEGPYDTIGFAGFFGVAMSVRRLEWDHSEARCPVLVSPSISAVERSLDGDVAKAQVNRMFDRDRRIAGLASVHAQTKNGVGAPFVMAEATGWITGPLAAAKTLLPARASTPERPSSVMELERGPDPDADLEQRTFLAEAVLRTMGLIQGFAPLVVLCGHTSHTVNNPHATALECGACAGASGRDNARAVARLLNDVEVRDGLRERDIHIPEQTWFLGAVHETVSDRVELLDQHDVPAAHMKRLERLEADLANAGARQAAQRATHLPGTAATVRQRGADWAQVRPEWGLAGNAAFIIGPRSMTAGLDLEGRAFLHTYEADSDPEGKVLETIMTAPLVVGHWISAQYYFSTVDPEVFGAGDKLIHNIVADTGVISGESGDLRVGLPNQSTHVGGDRHHQPVRLLAAIQAPLERIERIIERNPILTTLTAGSWIRVAGRSHPHERWSMRTPDGTWNTEPLPIDHTHTDSAGTHQPAADSQPTDSPHNMETS